MFATPQQPKLVGYYIIEKDIHFHTSHKKNWFQRKMIERCFGFKWVDTTE